MATTTSEPAAKEAVLMLSTVYSSNVPMVIGYNGKRHKVFLILSNHIIKVNLTMILTSYMMPILKLIVHVRRL